jgi:hypothetical protein
MLMMIDTDWSSISSAAREVIVLYPVPSHHHVSLPVTRSFQDISLVIASVYVLPSSKHIN